MLKNLKLERPIAFIDVETTGINLNSDRVVEISIYKINPDGKEEYKSHRVNPGIPIPAEATAVHHIKDADVVDLPAFRQYAKSLRDFLEGCDIAGFNVIKFDLPCIETEFARAGVEFSRHGRYLVDSMVIFHQRERRDLEAAYRKYCGGKMENAHCAQDDAKAASEVLDGQLEMYGDLPKDMAGLGAICNEVREDYIDAEGKFIWVNGEAVCNFGKKYKGYKLRDIVATDPSYLNWISSADFPTEVKEITAKALNGIFPKSL